MFIVVYQIFHKTFVFQLLFFFLIMRYERINWPLKGLKGHFPFLKTFSRPLETFSRPLGASRLLSMAPCKRIFSLVLSNSCDVSLTLKRIRRIIISNCEVEILIKSFLSLLNALKLVKRYTLLRSKTCLKLRGTRPTNTSSCITSCYLSHFRKRETKSKQVLPLLRFSFGLLFLRVTRSLHSSFVLPHPCFPTYKLCSNFCDKKG